MGPSFKVRQLVPNKDAVPTIFNFPMESCKPTIGEKNKTNISKQTTNNNNNNNNINNNEKEPINTRQTAGELLFGQFPSKLRFVFDSKTFPKNDVL